jgi:hypothetical protein
MNPFENVWGPWSSYEFGVNGDTGTTAQLGALTSWWEPSDNTHHIAYHLG